MAEVGINDVNFNIQLAKGEGLLNSPPLNCRFNVEYLIR